MVVAGIGWGPVASRQPRKNRQIRLMSKMTL